jgi:3-deoxy-D-manno-octulosonic-acid transferase
MLLVYRILYGVWYLGLWAASPFSTKVRAGLYGRKGLAQRLKGYRRDWKSRPYWFHFASAGEFEQAIPILESMKKRHPETPLFLSYFSPSGARAVQLEAVRRSQAGLAIPWDAADYSPLDFASSVWEFLALLRPKGLVLLNREFWPELLEECFKQKIDVYAFAVYFSNNKAKRLLFFYRRWLDRITFLGTTDQTTADFLTQELRTAQVQVIGDPRIERVLNRRQIAKSPLLSKEQGTRFFVAASLWPEDVKALIPSLKLLFRHPEWKVFLVPHEPEESFIKDLEALVDGAGAYSVRWTKRRANAPLPGVVVVDTVGWLAELYHHADLAFVGGAFRSRVHSVLEPAAYGVPILTGPKVANSFEALQMNEQKAGLRVANDADALADHVLSYLQSPAELKLQGAKALAFLNGKKGVGDKYCEILSSHSATL